jgi:hypothetical protein
MQQGKHTEYEKNLHDELMLSSTISAQQPTSTISESSIASATFSSATMVNTAGNGGESDSNAGGCSTTTATTTNGRATSESSEKLLSRSPSPQHQANGGWPNLLLEDSKCATQSKDNNIYDMARYCQMHLISCPAAASSSIIFDRSFEHRNHSPSSSLEIGNGGHSMLMNGNDINSYRSDINDTTKNQADVVNCDFNWGSGGGGGEGGGGGSFKDSYKDGADIFEEADDLGFDPFHETQKALAEMLESESQQVAQHQQQRHMLHQQSFATAHRQTNDSPPTQALRHDESPVMNRNPNAGFMAGLQRFGNDSSSLGGNHFGGNSSSSGPGRVKQPPPGFDPLSMLNSGSNGQPTTQRNLLSPGIVMMLMMTVYIVCGGRGRVRAIYKIDKMLHLFDQNSLFTFCILPCP